MTKVKTFTLDIIGEVDIPHDKIVEMALKIREIAMEYANPDDDIIISWKED